MKKVLRWTRRLALGVIAFVVLATAITLGTLHTRWGRERVRRIAEQQLQAVFPGSTIGEIDGSVLGDLIARDVTIVGRDRRPLATVKTLTLEAALRPLVGKTVRIDSILADDVVVYVHDQGPAPPEPPEPAPGGPSEPSTWSIEMPTIQVTNARVEIETARGIERIDALGAGVSLSLRAGEPLYAVVDATATWRDQPIAIHALAQNAGAVTVPYASISLGAARVQVLAAAIDGTNVTGTVRAHVPAGLAHELAAIDLPADVSLVARMSSGGALSASATLGTSRVDVLAKTDLDALAARAIVSADLPDLATLTRGATTGRASIVATVAATPTKLDGLVAIDGAAHGTSGSVLLGVDAALDRAHVLLASHLHDPTFATLRLGGSLLLEQSSGSWTLTGSQLEGSATSAYGNAAVSLTAKGALTPEPALSVEGTVDGTRVRAGELSIARAQTRFAAANLPARPEGSAQIEVTGLRQGTLAIPLASLGLRGILHEDGTIDVDLGRHRVRSPAGEWAGTGGHVRITATSIAATRIATASGKSRITAQATIGRTTDALTAKIAARDVPATLLASSPDQLLGGTLAADLDVSRNNGQWRGTATVDASQIAVPHRPIVDGKLAITIDKRRVTAVATASNPTIGRATIDLDVIGPRDITDPRAWQRLERSAIQNVRVALAEIDASKLGASGKLDGEIAIFASGAGGKVEVRGVETSVGTVDSQLALAAADQGEIATHGTLHLGGVDPVDVNAIIALPIHPFDPAGWAVLGREVLRDATIEAKRIAFEPALLKRLGVESSWRGWAAAKIHVGPGARTSDFTVTVHDLRDGPLTKPVEIELVGASDAAGVRADAKLRSDKVAMTLAAKSPLSVEAMLAGTAATAPIEATLDVPSAPARDIALLIGRDDVLAGTLGGSVKVEGTIATPIARAQLAIANLSVAAGISRKPPTLEKLELDARWLGVKTGFEFELTGHEAGGRLLKISARGKPESLDTVVASIEAANFDITPFLAFAPPDHPAVAMRGLVSGVLKLRGLDPDTGDVRGRLVISEARVPIAAELGNLRGATLELNVLDKEIIATLEGKIGRGTVKGKAIARLTGSMPSAAELTVALRKVSPIGEIQPVIDADISGYFVRTKTKWTGKLAIKHGNVYVPPDEGNELLITGTPSDIIFIDQHNVLIKPKRRPPSAPWLFADIDIEPTKIVVDDTDFNFNGVASGQLRLEVGDGIGLDGTIATERGVVEVLGRRYRLDHGVIDFDGSLDPRLDIQMMHDFPSMTLTVDVRGRSSEPDLRLSSDSGAYSQSQLLSFLAGATPSDDPASQSGDAVASGSLTILSSRIGRRINDKLPLLKFDTINYEAKTASSSRAIKLGRRLGEHTYLNYRYRFEPRPDENPSEAVVEWEVHKNIVIEGTGGQRAVGGDVLWRKRW